MLAYTGALRTMETTSVVAMCSRLRVLYHSETQNLQNQSIYFSTMGFYIVYLVPEGFYEHAQLVHALWGKAYGNRVRFAENGSRITFLSVQEENIWKDWELPGLRTNVLDSR